VVVVVATPPPPLLLFDNARIPNAITTPAPTSQSKGGSLSAWACFTPAADPGARGPVSADIAGNGAIAIAALEIIEISAFFTLSSPFLGILFHLFTIRNLEGQLDIPPPPRSEDIQHSPYLNEPIPQVHNDEDENCIP
jgi:hypothetical protein